MSHEFGSKIYVQKKRKDPWLVMVILLVLGASAFFYFYLKNPEPVIEPDTSITKKKREQKPIATPQNETEVQEQQEAVESKWDTVEPDDSGGDSEPEPSAELKNIDTSNMSPDLLKAFGFFLKKDYKNALEIFSHYSDSENIALLFTGICNYRLEDYQNSYSNLSRVAESEDKKVNFLSKKYLAFSCYKTDELDESLSFAEEGLELFEDAELQYLYKKLLREKKVMKGYGDRQKVHFKIQFSKFEHQEVQELVTDILQDAYRTVGQEIDFFPPDPVTVILYNEKGFFDVTRAPGWAGGLYDGKIRLPVRGVEGHEEELKRILVHEYTHALVHAITPKCPLWLNEGLAEYFSRGADEMKIKQLIPLKYLEHRFPSGDPRLVIAAYIESYSAVCYLIDKYDLYRIKELLEALGEGEELGTAFNSVFYITYQRFMDTWGKE
ncbi:MAG: hypothetical protein GY757_44950 [bacterium]|nr:hypothetical protein [bacterium]